MNPPTLPHQASAPDAEGTPTPTAEDRRHVVKRRWITAIIILLLVGVPAGYLAISTQQSRESGRDKAAKVGASKVRPGWPSKVQRSIYEVPVPDKAWRVGFLETNNWRTSRLYVQFAVTPADLDGFLSSLGIAREDLTPGCRSPRTTPRSPAGTGSRRPNGGGPPSNRPTRGPPGTSPSTSPIPRSSRSTWSPPPPRDTP